MITFNRLDHFHICVPEELLEEARAFYSAVIGLKEIPRPDIFPHPGYWFSIADAELHIGVEPALPRTIRHTALEVAEVAAAQKHLEAHGVEIIEESVIPGRVRFAFIDPFGNRWELLQFE
jgi:catechol 2,3-dioxygenase-like lactoylglutathione lyase family enzyme